MDTLLSYFPVSGSRIEWMKLNGARIDHSRMSNWDDDRRGQPVVMTMPAFFSK